jgi:hypothetical protein
MDCEMTINKPMKINQFKTNLRKKITSLKIGGNNNTQNKPQRKTPTHTHQKSMYLKNYLNSN